MDGSWLDRVPYDYKNTLKKDLLLVHIRCTHKRLLGYWIGIPVSTSWVGIRLCFVEYTQESDLFDNYAQWFQLTFINVVGKSGIQGVQYKKGGRWFLL